MDYLSQYFFITLTADILISVLRIMDRVIWIAWWIETVLKKQITLTTRVYIWDQCYELIKMQPIKGYGAGAHILRSGTYYSAHNLYFELLLEGGILVLLLFFVFNFQIGKKIIKYRNAPAADAFLSVLAGLYVIFIAEALLTPLVFGLLIMAYHVDKFDVADVTPHKPFKMNRGHHVPNRKLPEKY